MRLAVFAILLASARALPEQLTGFLNPKSNTSSGLFYWLHPAVNVDPETAPLIVWLQGGPGASSLLGALFENGPFALTEGSCVEQNETANPYAWNDRANLVYIDQPFGTGYSYGEEDDMVTDMDEMAKWLNLALVELAETRPEYVGGEGRPLWLTGESYAGKYVPFLATEIMSQNSDLAKRLSLGGLCIGDGWTEPQTIVGTYPDFAYSHGLVDSVQRQAMLDNITLFNAAMSSGDYLTATDIEHGIEHYVSAVAGTNAYDVRRFGDYDFSPAASWLARDDVASALGVSGRAWNLASDEVSAALHADVVLPASQLVGPLLEDHGLRVIFYNGVFDLDCNIMGTLEWMHAAVPNLSSAERKTWFLNTDDEPAGYAKTVGTFTQLTLNGAGHMVPMNIPEVALAMINQVMEGTEFGAQS
ncbi:hypothetical protein TrVE_jg14256 [Triparma verrucosa]|uniref:Carboxypeptidase n=1 Tax=Triparma verrucosa TaxID=1606542 RepID=A0A9W7C2U3_9STRA|nr:hypothetical protein TrVE_jg14256 [Triparma verrucosa]